MEQMETIKLKLLCGFMLTVSVLLSSCFATLTFPRGTTVPIADHFRGWRNSYICCKFDSKNITFILTVKLLGSSLLERCLSEGVRSHEIYMLSCNAFLFRIWNSSIRELYFSSEAWTVAGHDEHFCTGHGQICSAVCHGLSGMIKLYLSELLAVKGKSSAFGFWECKRFTAVKIQAAMRRPWSL